MPNTDLLRTWWAGLTPQQQAEARQVRSGTTPPPSWLAESLATAFSLPHISSAWWIRDPDPEDDAHSVRAEVLDFIAAQRGSWSVYAWATGPEDADVTAALSLLATGDLGGTVRDGGLGAGTGTVSALLDDVDASSGEEACDIAIAKIGAVLGSDWTVEADTDTTPYEKPDAPGS